MNKLVRTVFKEGMVQCLSASGLRHFFGNVHELSNICFSASQAEAFPLAERSDNENRRVRHRLQTERCAHVTWDLSGSSLQTRETVLLMNNQSRIKCFYLGHLAMDYYMFFVRSADLTKHSFLEQPFVKIWLLQASPNLRNSTYIVINTPRITRKGVFLKSLLHKRKV